MVATDHGNGTATLVHGYYIVGTNPSQTGMAALTGVQTFDYLKALPGTSTANFIDTFTLTLTTTLDFFIDDGFLPDNAGGVSVSIGAVPVPPTIALFASAFSILSGLVVRRQHRNLKFGAGDSPFQSKYESERGGVERI